MVRVGVFGANPKGERHIQYITKIPGFELKGIYDPDQDAAKKISERYNIPQFTTPDALIISCDALDFELSLELHFDLLTRLLTHSKHVLVNYPVSLSLEKITQLIKLGREANVIIQISNQERLNPALQGVIPYLKKPMYIEIRRNRNPTQDDMEEEALKAVLVRDIDLALHLGRSNVQRVNATAMPLVNDLTDLINARLEFDNGCVANITCNRFSNFTGMDCTIFQQGEWFTVDFNQNLVTMFQVKNHRDNAESPYTGKHSNNSIEVKRINPASEDQFRELAIFRDVIVHQQAPLVDMEEAYFAVKILFDLMENITKKA